VRRQRRALFVGQCTEAQQLSHERPLLAPLAAWAVLAKTAAQDASSSGPNALAGFRWRPSRLRLALSLFLHSVPNFIYAISRDVARLLVLNVGVERFATVGPLLGAVVAGDQSQIADRLVAG
jgi:hypothetical protein